MDQYKDTSIGVIIECEGGYVQVTSNYGETKAFDKDGKEIKAFHGTDNHFDNFIKAVRSRKQSDLNADILEGHISSAICHTGNISHRIGAQKNPDEIREAIKGERDAANTFNRMAEHLVANGVDLTKTKATLGPVLKLNTKSESFINNAPANKLLKREYRKPFVVPETV
jgi:hypothetical protein